MAFQRNYVNDAERIAIGLHVFLSTRSKVFGYFPARVSFPGRAWCGLPTLPGKETLAGAPGTCTS